VKHICQNVTNVTKWVLVQCGKSGQTEHLIPEESEHIKPEESEHPIPEQTEHLCPVQSEQSKIKYLPGY